MKKQIHGSTLFSLWYIKCTLKQFLTISWFMIHSISLVEMKLLIGRTKHTCENKIKVRGTTSSLVDVKAHSSSALSPSFSDI